jgi:hypothetical protein
MRWPLLACLPAMLVAADIKIDHVTVAGRDLRKLQAGLQAIGIPTIYGGPHANGTTEMALTSFPDGSYLEAIAIRSGADPALVEKHEWARFLKEDAVVCAWAIRGGPQSLGVPVGAPVHAGRRRPDGVQLEWETSDIGDGPRGRFFPFLIRDFTPREKRVYPQGKPVSREFSGVVRVVIGVRELGAAITQYRKAFGLPDAIKQVDQDFGAQLAIVGDAPVILAQPLHTGSWLDQLIERDGEGPCAFLLGAVHPDRHKTATGSRWFGREISWFDQSQLGWRLGYERPR